MELSTAKGTRDLYPEDVILLERAVRVLRRNFELFGFSPLETPSIENLSVLASKYTGGAEILKETFKLKDQGGRDLGLRYDLTVPFARFVAMNPQLKMPFKRYQIGRVFRDGPVSTNRLREFTQCDCDVVGTKSLAADAECILLFLQCFQEMGLAVEVRVNNRKILDELMAALQIKENLRERVILAIDKLDKKTKKEVEDEIVALGIPRNTVEKLFTVFDSQGTNEEILKRISAVVGVESVGVAELREVLSYVDSVKVVPSLARGLAYYTGTIFEVYYTEIRQSIGSGGRYDKMISALLGSSQEYPAVGCSFGLDVIMNALKTRREKVEKSVVSVYVVPIGLPVAKVWGIVSELRAGGVATDVAFASKGVSKGLEYANAYTIPYVVLVGEDELKAKKVKLKDMKTGKEELLSVKQVVKKMMQKP